MTSRSFSTIISGKFFTPCLITIMVFEKSSIIITNKTLILFTILLLLLAGSTQMVHGQCAGAAGPDQTFSCTIDTLGSIRMAASGTGKWIQLTSNPSGVTITDTLSPTTTITRFSLPGTYSFIWTITSSGCSDTVQVAINNQCNCFNSNFSDSTFRGWTGTWGNSYQSGGCTVSYPFQFNTFNQGPMNFPSNSTLRQYSQVITSTAGGNEPYLASLGINIPVAYPGTGASGYSARIGNTWPNISSGGGGGGGNSTPDAESITYTFNVTAANAGFTYYYFPILNQGNHNPSEQPYLKIKMVSNNTDTILCALVDVDATHARTIGGFDSVNDNGSGGSGLRAGVVYYKPWTTVYVPLLSYVGTTVKATFSTRSCNPNGCAGKHFAIAYIYAQCGPLIPISVVPANTCTQNRYLLTAPPGMSTYVWSGPGIAHDSVASIIVTQTGRYNVTMTPFSISPCPFVLDTFITIDTLLAFKAKFSHDSACIGDTIHFHDLSTPVGQIASWAWDFHNTSTTNSTLQNPSYIFTSAGTNTVKLSVVSTIGCIYDTIIPVTVYPLPSASITQPSGPICGGYNETLTAHGGITYIWSTGTQTNTNNVSPLIDSTYTVTVTDSHGCSASAATTVTPIPSPVATITPTSTPICIGGGDTLTTGVGTSYTWSTGANTISIIVAPTITTKYSVTVTGANGCTANDTVTVRVNPLPIPSITLIHAQICIGNSDTLIGGGGGTYVWSTLATTDTIIVSPGITTPYSLTVTDTNHCTASITKNVIVNPSPTPTITLSSAQICSGYKDTLIAGGGVNYIWNNGANQDTIIVSPTATGSYSVTVTDVNHCIDSITKIVTVVSSPTVTINATSAQICIGNNDTLTASGGGSYVWSNAASTNKIIVSPTTTTSYSVTVTGTNTCTASDTISLIVNPLPTPVIALTSIQICSGYPDTLIASGGNTYVWSNATNTDTVIVSPTATTQYTVIVTDANSCSDTASKTILVIPSPTPYINLPTPQICYGSSTTLTAAGGVAYQWSDAANTDTTTVSPTSTTTYSVTVTGANACTASASATVIVNPIPTLNLGPDTIVCEGLSYIIPGESSASTIVWLPDSGLSDPTYISPIFFTKDSVNYKYNVIAIDTSSGCADTGHLNIGTHTCISYIIGAQAFSPNGDGINDHYTLFSSQIASYEINIYNRWGELVYQSSDLTALNDTSKGWDGSYQGKLQPADVFVYYISAKDNFNKDMTKKGNITLLK